MATEGRADFEGAQTWYRVYGELPAPPNSPAPIRPDSSPTPEHAATRPDSSPSPAHAPIRPDSSPTLEHAAIRPDSSPSPAHAPIRPDSSPVGNAAAPGSAADPAPLVVLHGGPGATHDYLTPLAELSDTGRAVVLYDQLGNGKSTHYPDRGADFWTVDLFVRELASLIDQLGIGDRYHVLGQSWGGFLAQEHALTQPTGLRSLVLSNTAASFPDFVSEANRLRRDLPADVEATLRKHEADGTTDSADYVNACMVFYQRHVCRLDPWPDGVAAGFAKIDEDPTVYHTMNGPSEFHVIGSIRDWSSTDRLSEIQVPTYVVSGEHDEATPALQVPIVEGIRAAGNEVEQLVMAGCSHLPMWESPDVYRAAVEQWLRRHD